MGKFTYFKAHVMLPQYIVLMYSKVLVRFRNTKIDDYLEVWRYKIRKKL